MKRVHTRLLFLYEHFSMAKWRAIWKAGNWVAAASSSHRELNGACDGSRRGKFALEIFLNGLFESRLFRAKY